MDAVLLQSVEAMNDSSLAAGPGEMWELLQAEKENIERDILSNEQFRHEEARPTIESEPSEECLREIEWRRCETLEDRLRAINDAQDRLIDGAYGTCLECGKRIETRRLCADPAASLCLSCQELAEGELVAHTL